MGKRVLSLLLLLAVLLMLPACGQKQEQMKTHKIGVVVYDLKDEQVQAFRQYLEGYIAENFDVSFLYSAGVTTQEQELSFLREAISQGAEGILAFNSVDLEKEVALCAENGVYYIRPSSTTDPETFQKVADNPFFLGYFGPGNEMEYQAGYDMGTFFAQKGTSDSYFIVTGGAGTNVMHTQRTVGILDALQECYGVAFDKPTSELAATQEPLRIQVGTLRVCLFPGYIGVESVGKAAIEAFQKDPTGVVLGVIPLQSIADSLGNAALGIIDCYTEANGALFQSGRLQYLCGKYESIIGPAFAALYNAIGGYGADFREDGKAFAIQQGFWTSTSEQDYQEKYALSSGITLNAYSYEDLLQVCKASNSGATLEDLKALAGAWDFDSAALRRK